ncbi:MAG: hypothetical protein OEZ06_32940 [Myxococcales bacterium]|nr:hypothetical protein [Myxococcales bacterium]
MTERRSFKVGAVFVVCVSTLVSALGTAAQSPAPGPAVPSGDGDDGASPTVPAAQPPFRTNRAPGASATTLTVASVNTCSEAASLPDEDFGESAPFVRSLCNVLERNAAAYEAAERALGKQLEKAQAELKDGREKLKELVDALAARDKQLSLAEDKLSDLRATLKQESEKFTESHARVQELEVQTSELDSEAAGLRVAIASTAQNLLRERNHREQNQEKISELEGELKNKQELLREKESRLREREEQLQSKPSANDGLVLSLKL